MNYEWHDFVSNVGVFLILLCYLLVQLGRIDTQGIRYPIINGASAALRGVGSSRLE